MSMFDVLENPEVELPRVSSGIFFESCQILGDERDNFARIFVLPERLAKHQSRYPVIRESQWMPRDGHIRMDVPLDEGIPIEFLKSLIDDAYAIAWNKLDDYSRSLIELAYTPYDEIKLLHHFIEIHNLQIRRAEIVRLVRRAILLRTSKSTDQKIGLGHTKIGGHPDLPIETEWPVYRNGKPLAFLAQIDLAEIAGLSSSLEGLPAQGLLSFFSVWGWTNDDDLDPQTPNDADESQIGWSIALITPPGSQLERRETPKSVNHFQAAAVEPVSMLSLPNDRAEPCLAALGWSDDDYERFDAMLMDYRSLQMRHWLKQMSSDASHHRLGGYALFQQQFETYVINNGSTMFLQIGTDGNTGMCWSDGGELTFYVDAEALRHGRFERPWGTCQGG